MIPPAMPVESATERPVTPWTWTGCDVALPTGIGIGNVVVGSPIALIADASPGEIPGWASRYVSRSAADAPVDVTVRAVVWPLISDAAFGVSAALALPGFA